MCRCSFFIGVSLKINRINKKHVWPISNVDCRHWSLFFAQSSSSVNELVRLWKTCLYRQGRKSKRTFIEKQQVRWVKNAWFMFLDKDCSGLDWIPLTDLLHTEFPTWNTGIATGYIVRVFSPPLYPVTIVTPYTLNITLVLYYHFSNNHPQVHLPLKMQI